MSYIPFQGINMIYGEYSPNDIQEGSNSFDYWVRSLFQRACYCIKLDMQNDFTDRTLNFLYYCLMRYGYVGYWNDETYGKIFQPCGLRGYNIYYQPTNIIVSNPKIKISENEKNRTIGEDCELIQLTPDYRGIWDIIEYYAKKLSMLDPAIDVSITNSKVPFILFGKTKSARESLKKLIDKINSGLSSIFVDSRLVPDEKGNDPISMIDRPHLKDSYLTDRLLQDRMTIIQEFDREIGIATVPYQKKERMVQFEAESTQEESQARVTIWMECLNNSLEIINRKYGTNYKAERRNVNEYSKNNFDRVGELS